MQPASELALCRAGRPDEQEVLTGCCHQQSQLERLVALDETLPEGVVEDTNPARQFESR